MEQDFHARRVGFCRVILQADPALVSEDDFLAAWEFWQEQQRQATLERERLLMLLLCHLPHGNKADGILSMLPTLRAEYQRKGEKEKAPMLTQQQEDLINEYLSKMT